MHIVEIRGGLGNQMFCYAFGQNFVDVLYDVSTYDKSKKRALDLSRFNVRLSCATKKQTAPYLKKSKWPRFIRKIFNLPNYRNVTREKQNTIFEPSLFDVEDSYFKGYFQNENYFKNLRPQILQDFKLLEPLNQENASLLKQIKQTNSVSLHIRRGDYLNSSFKNLDVKEYYQKAIDYIASKIKNPHFYIFSNDFAWVKENIKTGYEQTIVDINDESHGYFDLELMRHCQHNIIANSTFSWWGAWLNKNPDKIVIAPKIWYLNEETTDINAKDWYQI